MLKEIKIYPRDNISVIVLSDPSEADYILSDLGITKNANSDDKQIYDILESFGISGTMGCEYFKKAIKIAMKFGSKKYSMSYEIYPIIASEFNVKKGTINNELFDTLNESKAYGVYKVKSFIDYCAETIKIMNMR